MNEGTNGHARPDATVVSTWTLPLDEHPQLDFHSTFASIAIVPVDDGVPRMFARTTGGELPAVDVRGENGTTRVLVGLEGERFRFWRDPGKIHLVLCVPPNVRGHLRTGSGRIDVGRLHGCNVELATDAGAIRAEEIEGTLRLKSSTGRIQALGISGALDVQSTAGAMQIHIERLDPGTHRVRTHVGAIEVDLAPGLPVRVDATTHLGRAHVNVPSYPDAPAVLEVRTHVGAVRVTGARPARYAGSPYRSPHAGEDEGGGGDEIERVVTLVVRGRITPQEAEDLLAAIQL